MSAAETWESVELAASAAESILRAAKDSHPLEACGLLLGADRRIDGATVARNVADDPARRFSIDPAHLLHWQRAAREGGQAVIGCWHSHPDGQTWPSAHDREGAQGLGLLWLIVGGDAMALWQPTAQAFRMLRLVPAPAGL